MTEQEMYSPERIAKRVAWYKSHVEIYQKSPYRRDQEYGNYLERYFEEQAINPNSGYTEPMPYNIYFS